MHVAKGTLSPVARSFLDLYAFVLITILCQEPILCSAIPGTLIHKKLLYLLVESSLIEEQIYIVMVQTMPWLRTKIYQLAYTTGSLDKLKLIKSLKQLTKHAVMNYASGQKYTIVTIIDRPT